AAGARAAIRESSGGLVEEGTAAQARQELAARTGPALPRRQVPHPPTVSLPLPPPEGRRAWLIAASIVAAVLVLAGLGVVGWHTAQSDRAQPLGSTQSHSATPRPSSPPSPRPLPSIQTASGPVKSVAET